jgi:nucleoside-diphosphate-sugar epimerase
MDSRKKVLVTGAAGFTGWHACHHLLESGYEVAGTVRKKTAASAGWELVECDLTDVEQTAQMISLVKPDLVLHLAGRNSVPDSWKDPAGYLKANVIGTANLLASVQRTNPACRILITGSSLETAASGGGPAHPYGLSKAMQTMTAKAWQSLFEQNTMLVQPTNLIGPGPSRGVLSVLASKVARIEAGMAEGGLQISNSQESRDFLDVRDAVKAYTLILEQGMPGAAYELGSGVPHTLLEVCKELRKHSHTAFKIEDLGQQPSADSRRGKTGLPVWQQELGWEPSFAFSQSVSDILQYHRELLVKEKEHGTGSFHNHSIL